MKNINKKLIALLVLLLCLLIISSGCGSVDPNVDSTNEKGDIAFIAHYISPINDWDPSIAGGTENQILFNIYETLLLYEPETDTFEPVLAIEYSKNEDGTIWTFKLREGVEFHDGTPFNAKAVKFSFERTRDIGKGSSYIWHDLQKVNVLDDFTVELIFNQATPADLLVSCALSAFIMSPTAFTNDYEIGTSWCTEGNACGTGPYKLQSQILANEAILTKNDKYWRGWDGDHFEKIRIQLVNENASRRQMLESGEADVVMSLMAADVKEVEKNDKITVNYADVYANNIVFLNTKKPPLNNKLVRQALAYAFPYEEIIQYVKLGFGKIAKDIVPQSMWGANPGEPYYYYDLEKAKELLCRAGYPDGGFTLTYTYTAGNEDRKKTAELFKSELSKLGITLDIKGMQWDNMMAIVRSENEKERQDITTWIQFNDIVAPSIWYMQNVHTEEPVIWNHSYYSNPALDVKIEEANRMIGINREESARMFQEIGKEVADECISIYSGDEIGTILTQSNFKGYKPNPAYRDVIFFYNCYREK